MPQATVIQQPLIIYTFAAPPAAIIRPQERAEGYFMQLHMVFGSDRDIRCPGAELPLLWEPQLKIPQLLDG